MTLSSPLGAALLLLLHREGPWCPSMQPKHGLLGGLSPRGSPKPRGRFPPGCSALPRTRAADVCQGAPYESQCLHEVRSHEDGCLSSGAI